MLKVKTIPVLSRMIAKLDVRPILTKLKEADIFKSAGNKNNRFTRSSPPKETGSS